MKLHIFNPEHDLALAANLKQFTAPHAGRQLRSDLAFIPALWAEEGDLVLVDDIDFAKNRVRHFGAELNSKVEFITKPQLKHLLKTEFLDSVHPWGWNLSLKGEFICSVAWNMLLRRLASKNSFSSTAKLLSRLPGAVAGGE